MSIAAKLSNWAVTAAKIAPAAVAGGLEVDNTSLRLADGFVSVAANASYPRDAIIETEQASSGTAGGRVGRFRSDGGGSDFLGAPLALPHGARIISFSYTVYDTDASLNSGAFLYSDNGQIGANITSTGDSGVQTVTTAIPNVVVDNSLYSYWVYMGISGTAGSALSPINAVVGYTFD